jgi:predicted nucleotidyltransferase
MLAADLGVLMLDGERVISPGLIENLPTTVATVLEEFVAAAVRAVGPRLDSVILFGSGAEGRLRPTSDVNLLVVADGLTLPELDSMRLALREGRAAARLTVMFVEKAELAQAMEAFALKFTDIKARHRVLYGKSPLESLQITREAALRRVHQVLLNLRLRLRESYTLEGDHEERLAQIIADVVGPVRASAATLLALAGGRSLAPKLALEAFIGGGEWTAVLNDLSTVHRGEHLAPGHTRRLFGDVLRLLAALDARARELH